jgi:hypothetical protein
LQKQTNKNKQTNKQTNKKSRVRTHGRNKNIPQLMRPSLTACSRPLSCPPWSPVSDRFLSPQMFHSAALDMTETGTEARATTRDKYDFLSTKSNPTVVNLNTPFLFCVLHSDSENIDFMGKINNPAQN